VTALSDRVSRVRAEIAAVESAQGRFDHGNQNVAQTVARVRAEMRESEMMRAPMRGLLDNADGSPRFTEAQQRVGRIVVPAAIVALVVGIWSRSWKSAAISGGITAGITGVGILAFDAVYSRNMSSSASGTLLDASSLPRADADGTQSWASGAPCGGEKPPVSCYRCPEGTYAVDIANIRASRRDVRCAPNGMG